MLTLTTARRCEGLSTILLYYCYNTLPRARPPAAARRHLAPSPLSCKCVSHISTSPPPLTCSLVPGPRACRLYCYASLHSTLLYYHLY